ncbi:MAG: hypothetical protein L3I91_02780 [Mycoplasma sp.]
MRALFRIYNKGYWFSVFGPILTFIIPLLYVLFISNVYIFLNNYELIPLFLAVYPTLIWTIPYLIMLLILPQAIFEIRDSVLIKQLKSSSVKLWQVVLVGLIFYSGVTIVSFFDGFISAYFLLFTQPKISSSVLWMYNQINFWELLYVIFANLLMGLSFGGLLGTVFKKSSISNLIGLSLVFFSIVLAGFATPITLAREQLPLIWFISYFDFIRYGSTMTFEAIYSHKCAYNLLGSGIFDFDRQYKTLISVLVDIPFNVFNKLDKILNFVVPYGIAFGSIISTLVFMKGK